MKRTTKAAVALAFIGSMVAAVVAAGAWFLPSILGGASKSAAPTANTTEVSEKPGGGFLGAVMQLGEAIFPGKDGKGLGTGGFNTVYGE